MKPTITTCTLLPAITTTRAARIAAAAARHPNLTPDCIMLPTIGDYIILYAARDLRKVTRARYSSSAQPLMLQLYHDAQQYVRATYAADTITSADAARDEAATLRDAATANTRTADRISTPAVQADGLRAEADTMRSDAAELVQTALDVERHAPGLMPFGDGADIAQDAALQRWIDYTAGKPLHESASRSARSAAGRAITAAKAAAGIPATRTKVDSFTAIAAADLQRAGRLPRDAGSKSHPYTDEQRGMISVHADVMRKALLARYASADKIPFSVREGMTAGYYTVEYRNSARFPANWYRVAHYATFAPIRLDDYAIGAAEDSDSRATLADTVREIRPYMIPGAEPQPCDIITAAQLSERERRILDRATSTTDPIMAAIDVRAAERYQIATDTHAATLDPRSARKYRAARARRETTARAKATLRAAVKLEGLDPNKDRHVLSRIRSKLTAARDEIAVSRRNSSGAPHITPAPRVIWWYDTQGPQTADPAPVIQWTRRSYAQDTQTISTPAQREQDAIARRAGEIAAYERKQAAAAARAAAVAASTARADDYFIKPAAASAAVFMAAARAQREAVFDRNYDRWEAAQKRRNAAQDAQQTTAAEERRNRYNAALRAALHEMGVTWQTATPAQRQQATAAAQTARG